MIVVNGDEGDPGSYIDKQLIERNPALLLEGMALAGYAVGADRGYVYVRSEYPLSKPALVAAIEAALAAGDLGDDIHGSGFSFHVDVVEGAGSYVVGEETALLNSLRGCGERSRRGRRSRRRRATTRSRQWSTTSRRCATRPSSPNGAPTPTRR